MPVLAAGELSTRVTVEAPQRSITAAGDRPISWTVVGTRWAAVRPIGARERILAGQLGSVLTHRVRMRYWAAVRPNMRLRLGQRILNIESVAVPDEGREQLELLCSEVLDV